MSKSQWRYLDWDLNRDLSHFKDSISDVNIVFETLRFDLRFGVGNLRFYFLNSYIVQIVTQYLQRKSHVTACTVEALLLRIQFNSQ